MLRINSNTKVTNFNIEMLHRYFLENDINSFNKEIDEAMKYIDNKDLITFKDIANNLNKYKAFIHFRLESEKIKGYHLGLYSKEDRRFYVIRTFDWYTRREFKSNFDVMTVTVDSNYYLETVKCFVEIDFDENLLEDIKKQYNDL